MRAFKELADGIIRTQALFGLNFVSLAVSVTELNASLGEDKMRLAKASIVIAGGDLVV